MRAFEQAKLLAAGMMLAVNVCVLFTATGPASVLCSIGAVASVLYFLGRLLPMQGGATGDDFFNALHARDPRRQDWYNPAEPNWRPDGWDRSSELFPGDNPHPLPSSGVAPTVQSPSFAGGDCPDAFTAQMEAEIDALTAKDLEIMRHMHDLPSADMQTACTLADEAVAQGRDALLMVQLAFARGEISRDTMWEFAKQYRPVAVAERTQKPDAAGLSLPVGKRRIDLED